MVGKRDCSASPPWAGPAMPEPAIFFRGAGGKARLVFQGHRNTNLTTLVRHSESDGG